MTARLLIKRADSRLNKKHVKKENGEAQVILPLRIRRIRSLRNPLLLQIQTDA
jgi:hypothetical protein